MFSKIKATWQEFPPKFWILLGASFIDVIGSTLIYPFFALYLTQKFSIGMTQAGALLAIFFIAGMLGSVIGGALTDKFGRRATLLFGLVFSALSSLSLGIVNDLVAFYPLVAIAGLLSNVGGPARQAIVADLLPAPKRVEGYGTLRVAANLAWTIGPMIGGLLAAYSYLFLFILDAVASLTTAVIVYKLIPETKVLPKTELPQQNFLETLGGYRQVVKDGLYVAFLLASVLMLIAYRQSYNTLSVFLRDMHGISAQGYGFLISLDAITVVLFQFWFTRRTKQYTPMLMMIAGTGFFMVGLVMFGFVSTFAFFIVAILFITIGEMIVMPTGQALVVCFAPEDMRGRYMGVYALSWSLPSALAPWAAGLVMDNYNPNWVWYASGVLCALAITGFCFLHLKIRRRFAPSTAEKQPALAMS